MEKIRGGMTRQFKVKLIIFCFKLGINQLGRDFLIIHPIHYFLAKFIPMIFKFSFNETFLQDKRMPTIQAEIY